MACYIFGAGDFYGIRRRPAPSDRIIAADGGWPACRSLGLVPELLLGDFDSLPEMPDTVPIRRVPAEKDDTDMMLAIKEGLAWGEREFHLYGGMGGERTDHTIANLQALRYLAVHGARGWLYGRNERFTVIHCGSITLEEQKGGILSVFCIGPDASGVTVSGAQYSLRDAALTASFPLGVSNRFAGAPVTVSVKRGSLLIGLCE